MSTKQWEKVTVAWALISPSGRGWIHSYSMIYDFMTESFAFFAGARDPIATHLTVAAFPALLFCGRFINSQSMQ